MAAKETKLGELHEVMANYFLGLFEDEECPPSAATLGVIRGFLKDSEVTAQADDEKSTSLRSKLAKKPLASVTHIDKALEM